jgi:hypothetical protein
MLCSQFSAEKIGVVLKNHCFDQIFHTLALLRIKTTIFFAIFWENILKIITPVPVLLQVIEHYKKTKGQTRGQAIVNYMTIVESMPTYGVHYFEVYDKRQNPWWLGLSCRGIAQYNHNDRKTPGTTCLLVPLFLCLFVCLFV